MDRIMKKLLIAFALILAQTGMAQISVSGGMNMLKTFSPDRPYAGLHIGLEIPRDDAISIYGRYTHNFSQSTSTPLLASDYAIYIEPRDNMSGLYGDYIGATPSMNYNIIEGGTRYYLGNGFDYGFAGYGGTTLMIAFSKVKMNYDPYDEVNYRVAQGSYIDGSIFSVGFGLGGGVKYTMTPYGTFYFDVNVNYMILAQASNNYVFPDMYRPLIFTFNLGFRKDFMW